MRLVLGGALAAASIALAAPAQADEPFMTCPSGRTGVATTVTSCGFADNVRYAWFHQPGRTVAAYSPTTGMVYTMYCDPNYTATMNTGMVVTATHCVGGNNAVVVFW